MATYLITCAEVRGGGGRGRGGAGEEGNNHCLGRDLSFQRSRAKFRYGA